MSKLAISAERLRDLMLRPGAIVVDVRRDAELGNGMVPGARHLPLHRLEKDVVNDITDPSSPIVVYCAHGVRSFQAQEVLHRLGYAKVWQLEGGFARWLELKYPIEHATPTGSSPSSDRYSRQVLLAELGTAGQRRLAQARVLLIGLGGLGSPAAIYLAAAGIGTLGLVDPDIVDLSNLHRQILHDTGHLGTGKVESARQRIQSANPEVNVFGFAERFVADNAARVLASGWDVILDGADNFPTRYVLNDVAIRHGLPVCHGSIDRFEGCVTTFLGKKGPCYRCLFPRPPQPGVIGGCADRGVLGVLPGVIGVLQATEALKILLGIGQPLVGRLVTYDALDLRFREMRYGSDPNCPTCRARAMMGTPCR